MVRQNNGEQREYTFINMKRSYSQKQDGPRKDFTSITLEAFVVKPDRSITTTPSGRRVISFRTPIHNRTQYIASMCGLEPVESEDGTVWARVSMWDPADMQKKGAATRLDNLLNKVSGNLTLLITGSIEVKDTVSQKDGQTYRNVNINADDFTIMGRGSRSSGSQNGSGNKAAGSNQNTDKQAESVSAEVPAGQNANGEAVTGDIFPDGQNGNFYTMEELDDELPF